jgi:NADH dehydrogenase [ubiquinone] 1 alpha subcomplex assembly factor 7
VPKATWHESIASLPSLPTIIIANEFFDALPIQQFECCEGQVSERIVRCENGQLVHGLQPSPAKNPFSTDGIFELAPARQHLAHALGHAIQRNTGSALIIDYGHKMSAMGDTLQAMMAHGHSDILHRPGEADITSHVDFEALGLAFRSADVNVWDIMTQGEFLQQMGISLRTEVLARNLEGVEREQFIAGSHRLADPAGMGQLFKVMAVTSHGQPAPYPFGEA